MAHYAFINEDKIVTEVITGRDENDLAQGITSWETYYGDFRGQRCLQTSYNTHGGVHYTTDDKGNRMPSEDQTKALRKNYAGPGFTYDEERDAFIPPKPEDGEWVLDEDTCLWVEVVNETD
jgi:hypothetical protein